MTPTAVLAVLLAFAALALATLAGWAVAAVAQLAMQRLHHVGLPGGKSRATYYPSNISAGARAALLAQVRLMPLAFVVVVVPAQIIGFARFEVGGGETAGPLLLAAALAGVALFIEAVVSGVRSWQHTRAIVVRWRPSASALTVPGWRRPAWTIRWRFPVVAVVGVRRPELFVAAQVATECSVKELAAIAAHETAHVKSRDNLLRLLFRLTPGARLASAIAAPLEHAWMIAAEEAADAEARQATSALELASALAKVARLATESQPEALPASALIGGDQLEVRIHRLLGPPVEHRRRALAWMPAALVIVAAITAQVGPVPATLHELFELLVRR